MVTVENILALLRQEGPMTDVEIRRWFNCDDKRAVSRVLHKLRKVSKTKRVFICGWIFYDPDGQGRRYPRAKYKIGSQKCVPKPPPLPSVITTKTYQDKKRLPKQVAHNSSVFTMAKAGLLCGNA